MARPARLCRASISLACEARRAGHPVGARLRAHDSLPPDLIPFDRSLRAALCSPAHGRDQRRTQQGTAKMRVGVVGIGAMGFGMAKHVKNKGFELTTHARSPDKLERD